MSITEIPIDDSTTLEYPAAVNTIQSGEVVKGGDETMPANKQAVALAKRTAWLHAQLAALPPGITDLITADGLQYVREWKVGDPAPTWQQVVIPTAGIPEAPTTPGTVWVRSGENTNWEQYIAPTLTSLGGVASTALGVSVATLVSGKVPASQLPSYVDEILPFANFAAFPATGDTRTIYIADDTNIQYRWSGTGYVGLVASPGTTDAVVEGTTNLYFTQPRVLATSLTGLSVAVSSHIFPTDSVLSGLGKAQAQINNLGSKANSGANSDITSLTGLTTPLSVAQGGTGGTSYVPGFADAPANGNSYLRVNNGWGQYTPPTLSALGGVATSALGVTVATLVSGIVPASQLPSYVSAVKEFANLAAFPATGVSGTIYIADDTNLQYRWGGSNYIQLVSSPGTTDAVVEGTTNLYFTIPRVLAATLTGFSTATNSAVVATDSVLIGMGKIQAQINANATAIAGKAAKGANSDITSLTGLTTPLSVAQGGTGGTSYVPGFSDAPADSNSYLRKNNGWTLYTAPSAGLTDAPNDGKSYLRQSQAWVSFDKYTLAIVAAAAGVLDLSVAQCFTVANSSATTISFKTGTTPGAGRAMVVVLKITGSATITWPGSIAWTGGVVPALGATSTNINLFWDGSQWTGAAGITI